MNNEEVKIILENIQKQVESAQKELLVLIDNEVLGWWKALLKEVIDIRLLIDYLIKEK